MPPVMVKSILPSMPVGQSGFVGMADNFKGSKIVILTAIGVLSHTPITAVIQIVVFKVGVKV